jgi:hypothetical protein
MDLSENGKLLFTSLQYVKSSHAPYQRIRFFQKFVRIVFIFIFFDFFASKVFEFCSKTVFEGFETNIWNTSYFIVNQSRIVE